MSSAQGGMPIIIPDIPNVPDVPDQSDFAKPSSGAKVGGMVDFGGLVQSFTQLGSAMNQANSAEQAFIAGKGNLMEMVLERTRADMLLQVASATSSKVVQSAQTIMNMQV